MQNKSVFYKTNYSQPTPKTITTPRSIDTSYDDNYQRFVGWDKIAPYQGGYDMFFSETNIQFLSNSIHEELKKRGFNMVIAPNVLSGLMGSVWRTNVPVRGDLYTLFIIPNEPPNDDLVQLNSRVINIAVNTITDEMENTKANESLSAWTQVLGEFNAHKIRSHPIIKLKENRHRVGFFVMNY